MRSNRIWSTKRSQLAYLHRSSTKCSEIRKIRGPSAFRFLERSQTIADTHTVDVSPFYHLRIAKPPFRMVKIAVAGGTGSTFSNRSYRDLTLIAHQVLHAKS